MTGSAKALGLCETGSYYLKQGFTYVRTVVLPHNPSGALFQRPAQRMTTPHLHEVESLTG
jgi:hypothetical protein